MAGDPESMSIVTNLLEQAERLGVAGNPDRVRLPRQTNLLHPFGEPGGVDFGTGRRVKTLPAPKVATQDSRRSGMAQTEVVTNLTAVERINHI